MLSEISQAQKDKYCTISLEGMRNLKMAKPKQNGGYQWLWEKQEDVGQKVQNCSYVG